MIKIEKILCPVDFSDHSQAALTYAADLARSLGSQLIVLHAVAPVLYPVAYGLAPVGPANYEEQARQAAEEKLGEIVAGLDKGGVFATSLVVTGTPWLRIPELVEEHKIDLVVMATHGLTGLKHALLGSNAEQVVRRCSCPVLTVKTGGKAA